MQAYSRDFKFAAASTLVQCFDVLKLVAEFKVARADFAMSKRVKHECVVWIGAMAYANQGCGHCEWLQV
jgi:hypothetical protein